MIGHEFGLYPKNFTPKMYWGARAIVRARGTTLKPDIDIPMDRQNFERSADSRFSKDDMCDWINNEVIPAISKKCEKRFFKAPDDVFTMDAPDGRYHCEASGLNSYGSYIYIGVWET